MWCTRMGPPEWEAEPPGDEVSVCLHLGYLQRTEWPCENGSCFGVPGCGAGASKLVGMFVAVVFERRAVVRVVPRVLSVTVNRPLNHRERERSW